MLVLAVGIGAQWLAWRSRLPAILLLLVAGLLVGPVTGLLRPDDVFGRDLVLSFANLGVAVILFEGGLTLRWKELHRTGAVVPLLSSLGILCNWIVGTAAILYIVKLNFQLSLLFGALMTVSGPTVIMPLLRQVRPLKRLRNVLKWEAIVADPIGAVLAVLVFELAVLHPFPGWQSAAQTGLMLLGTALLTGLVGAAAIVLFLRRFWVPDYLHAPLTLALVLSVFALSNVFFEESGLLAVTVMGIAMANQRYAKVEHILEFKENLRVLLISSLFVLLAARLDPSLMRLVGSASLLVVLALVLVARPICVFASTVFSSLTWRERLFLAGVMPRGIVAAAVSTVFALKLDQGGIPGGEDLAGFAILTVIATVFIYGLGVTPLARALKVADENPQGALVVGADAVGRAIGLAFKELGFRALLVDTDANKVFEARQAGFEAVTGSGLNEVLADDLDLTGIGKLIAVTPSDEVNDLCVLQWTPLFGRESVYRLAPKPNEGSEHHDHVHGRLLFDGKLRHRHLIEKLRNGAQVVSEPEEGATLLACSSATKLYIPTPRFEPPAAVKKSLYLT